MKIIDGICCRRRTRVFALDAGIFSAPGMLWRIVVVVESGQWRFHHSGIVGVTLLLLLLPVINS